MSPIDHKQIALNEVYNDINLMGYPRAFVYFCKGEFWIKEHPKIVSDILDEWLTLFGVTAKEKGAEQVYFFTPAKFVDADLPKPVPKDDINMAIHVFSFDISNGIEIRANRSLIEYRNPGKKVKVCPERFLEVDTEDHLLKLFFEGYESAEEKPEEG